MKIKIKNFKGNILREMRSLGYSPDFKKNIQKEHSFCRPLLGDKYPRFHIYYNEEKKEINLHLDHKAPRYKNAHDHGAEYEGRKIEEEAQRIEKFFTRKQ